jgi:hypothetical protein
MGDHQAASGHLHSLPHSAAPVQDGAQVEVGTDDALGVADLLGDPARLDQVFDIAGAGSQDVEGVALLGPGPTVRATTRASSARRRASPVRMATMSHWA